MIGVLVVDDDYRVARIHSNFVARVPGFTVVGVAHTGRDAIAMASQLHPDLVLLDLYLPDIHGLDVINQLRVAGHDCDMLVISAAKEATAIRASVRQGAVNYLLKPFGFDDLRRRLESYAAQRTGLSLDAVQDQTDVDRMLASATSRMTSTALPKGQSAETAALVERALRAADAGLSAAECAEQVGVSRVSARRYLEHLNETGRAEITLRYQATGRPERRYRWVG